MNNPPPPIHVAGGDTVTTAFRPRLLDFIHPIVALRVVLNPACVSGWEVFVNTTAGIKGFCSGHFRKKEE